MQENNLKMFFPRIFLPLLVLFFMKINTMDCTGSTPNVIIVGAGAAGIAAASKLFENGFKNITILEAKNRIGGRIHTTQFDNYWVDLGGQWIHGEKGNIAFELAKPFKLLERENFMDGDFELYDSSGTKMNQSTANRLKDIFLKILDSDAADVEGKNGSIGQYFVNELNKNFELIFKSRKTEGLLHFFDMLEMEDEGGDAWWDISTNSLSEYEVCPGANQINWKERGYSIILDILMKRYPNPKNELPVMKNTTLNAEVSLIYNDEKIGKVVVSTTGGDTYIADHVIVTVSLGVLKEKHISLFKPLLPKEKVRTINGLGFGCAAKTVFSFDKPWWTSKQPGFYFFWKDKDRVELEKDPEKSWLLGLDRFGFISHKPRLLYAWVSGKYSRKMERLSKEKVFNHTLEALQRFVGKYYNITMPTGMIRSTWNSKEYFKGVYTFFRTVKSKADNVWPATLAEPIVKKIPVILFAGEATSPHHFSTVHGAIDTGFREANRLINLYRGLKTANR